MATLEEMRQDVRDHIDEAVPAFWDNTMLDRWIWEAARDIARKTTSLQSKKDYDLVANQVTYDVPLDMIQVHRVEFRQTPTYCYALEYRTIDGMDDIWFTSREVAGSQPMYWAIWGTPGLESSQLYIYPIVSSNIEDGLRLYYYRLPRKPVEDDDQVEVPAGWEDLVPLYCEMVALRRGGSPRWQEANALYQERLGAMMEVTRQWSDQQTTISGAGRGLVSRYPWVAAGDGWY